jgi:lysophospholipase L1-like esterase
VFTFSDVVFGLIDGVTPQKRYKAQWSAAPTKVLNSFQNPADGSDYISPWVTDPALQFGPDQLNAIGLTIAAPNNGNGSGVSSTHPGWRSTVVGTANSLYTLASTGYFGNTLALDKRIEYEYEGTNPIGLLVGASGDEGYNLTTALDGAGGYEILPPHETWAGQHGLRTGTCWMNGAISAATQQPFRSADSLAYTRFDLGGSVTTPDFAVIGLGGNSMMAGTALATIQSEYSDVVDAIKSFGIKRIFHETIVPVGQAAGANETIRTSFNDWLRTLPFGAEGIIDVDLILRDPVNNLQQMPGFVDTDKIHPKHGGYARWAASVPSLIK